MKAGFHTGLVIVCVLAVTLMLYCSVDVVYCTVDVVCDVVFRAWTCNNFFSENLLLSSTIPVFHSVQLLLASGII